MRYAASTILTGRSDLRIATSSSNRPSPLRLRNLAAQTKIYVLSLLLAAVVGCVGRTTTMIQLSPATRAELDAILNTLQVRYDLTGSLKITRMMVKIEEGERSEELRSCYGIKNRRTVGNCSRSKC